MNNKRKIEETDVADNVQIKGTKQRLENFLDLDNRYLCVQLLAKIPSSRAIAELACHSKAWYEDYVGGTQDATAERNGHTQRKNSLPQDIYEFRKNVLKWKLRYDYFSRKRWFVDMPKHDQYAVLNFLEESGLRKCGVCGLENDLMLPNASVYYMSNKDVFCLNPDCESTEAIVGQLQLRYIFGSCKESHVFQDLKAIAGTLRITEDIILDAECTRYCKKCGLMSVQREEYLDDTNWDEGGLCLNCERNPCECEQCERCQSTECACVFCEECNLCRGCTGCEEVEAELCACDSDDSDNSLEGEGATSSSFSSSEDSFSLASDNSDSSSSF